MISSVPSYDEELLTGAYANIGLIADKGWAFHPDDPFRKLNHSLWVQNCKLTARYRENGNYQPRCVRDTISGSWLAQYGNYEYNEERERMYKPDDNIPVTPQNDFHNSAITEPWMLQEVEEHFARLSSPASLPLDDKLFTQLRQSSTSKGVNVPRQVAGRNTQSKWDAVLKKQNITARNSNGKDSAASTSYSTICTNETYYKSVEPEDYIKYPPLRYTVNNMAEMQLQINVTSDAVRDLWNPLKSPQQQQQQQKHFQYNHRQQPHVQSGRQQQHHLHSNKQQQYLQCGLQHQTLGMRTGRQSLYPESIGMMRQLPPPMLSAEVPEFFPKGPISRSKNYQEQSVPLQFFPSSAERSYQEELFPYNRGHMPGCGNVFQNACIAMHSMPIQQVSNTSSTRPTHQWIQRPSPALHVQVPVCPPHQSICTSVQSAGPTIIQRRIQMPDKIGGNMTQQSGLPSAPIPVYQRPPELYNDPSQRRKTQGVDFNNLILLTKNAMKARRNQSKNPQHSSSLILESRQPNMKSESDVLQWLEKGYPKKAEDFVAVNILVSDFENLEEKCNDGKTANFIENIGDVNRDGKDVTLPGLDRSSAKLTDIDPSSDTPTKRRLYRDVLTNSSSTEVILENVFDKRYDELERQAMEQYRTSEECLALRYQELERQAMEQYKNTDNGGASTSNSKSKTASPVTPAKKNQGDRSKSVIEDQDCFGGHKCSGFGHCSPIKDPPSPSEKGTPPPQQLTILRPESKPGISATYRVANHTNCSRPVIVTKSLTTLNQRFSCDSKNTTKGASGDKIDRNVQVSPKRRLILMSSSKLESEARPLKSSDLQESYAVRTLKTHVSQAYREPEVIQSGGGDEHVTILRSPGVEGIRKQLFLADEELMDSSPESLGVRLLEPTQLDEPCTKMDLVKNLKDKIIGVSPGMAVANIVDAAREDEVEYTSSGILQTIWQQQQEPGKFSNRITRNKKKQCKPHTVVAVKEAKFDRPNASPKKPTALLPRGKKYEIELNDIVPHNNVLTSKRQHTLRKPNLKPRPKSECQEIPPLAYFPLTTFENENYHTESSPCSSILLETVCYYVSLCSIANVDTSKLFVHKDSYSFLEKLGFGTAPVYFQNEVCSQNIFMVRYYDAAHIESHKICSMSPPRVLSLRNNSKVNDLWEIIRSDTKPQTMQTNNLPSANDYTQPHLATFRHKAVCEIHFDHINLLQIIPPTHFTSILLYEQSGYYQDRKKNV